MPFRVEVNLHSMNER